MTNPTERGDRGRRPAQGLDGAEAERERTRAAMVELISERGYLGIEIDDLLRRAGVDRAAFHRQYTSLEACFADLWERLSREFLERARAAYTAQETWRDGMRAQAWELFRFLSEDELRARICLVEVNFGSELMRATRDVFMDSYIELIHLGRHERGSGDIPRARAEALVGAIWERVARDAKAGRFGSPELVPQMLYLLVLTYLGPDAAREELRRGPEDVARYRRGEL